MKIESTASPAAPDARLVDEVRKANESTRSLADLYRGHRERTTNLVLAQAPAGPQATLCVLGAGNCLDLDLPLLAARFEEVHLVDIDREALEGAVAQASPEVRDRLVLHAPVDLSGMLDKLERWGRMVVTEAELLQHHQQTGQTLASELGSHDVVLSASFITQMQLSVLHALGDEHRLFDAVRHTLALTHLQSLYELTKPGGRALFVTDVLSNQNYHYLDRLPPDANMLKVLSDVIASERMIYVARPGLFHMLQRQDPTLRRATTLSPPLAAWVWQNGPDARFLVYAMALERKE